MVRAGMHVIVECAATEAVEMVVAAFQGAELGKNAEVPLSDESCTVASLAKQRWQGRMFRRQADFGITRQRLFQPYSQAVLVAAGDQSCARGGTNRRVGIGFEEAHARRGDAVDIRRMEIRPSVTGDVGVAQIVGQDEDDVGRLCLFLAEYISRAGGERKRSYGRVAEQSAAGNHVS